MPQDPKPQDPKQPEEPGEGLGVGGSERNTPEASHTHSNPGEDLRGEDQLRWEEEQYELSSVEPGGADDGLEPDWFADLLDERLDAEDRRCHQEALSEDPDLGERYQRYSRAKQALKSLGREEADDSGSPFLVSGCLRLVSLKRFISVSSSARI